MAALVQTGSASTWTAFRLGTFAAGVVLGVMVGGFALLAVVPLL